MKTHKTDKNTLSKGLKTMAMALGGLFLGPTLLHTALSNKEKPLYMPILVIASLICLLAIYFVFKGINTILNSMFNK